MKLLRALQKTLILIAGLLFFWLVIAKLIARLAARLGFHMPLPASLGRVLDSLWRRWSVRPVLGWAHIRTGEVVLELRPGTGVFTVETARRVGPKGRVVVVDARPQKIARVEQRAAGARLNNVETHTAGAYDLPLGDESIDRAFLTAALSEIPDPYLALDELNRVLKPGGLLSVTESFMDPDYVFPFETVQRVEGMGFRREQFFGNFWLYTLNFCKEEGITYD
jgi:SAM-dependent methyltransferase